MKGIIELSSFAVKTVSSKCITPSETEGEGDVTVNVWEMYGTMFSTEYFSMKPSYDLDLMHSKGVELDKLYLIAK